MKNIKKMMAIVLIAVMTMMYAVPVAFAAGHGSITINNAEANHTYTAYQILKGDFGSGKLSNVQWGDDVTDATKTALYTKYSLTGANQTAAKVAEAIEAASNAASGTAATVDDTAAIEFANTVGTNVTGGSTGSLSGTTYTISDLDDGYYMIVDTWAGDASATNGEDYTLARYMVQLVDQAVVNNKADKPTVDKDIVVDSTAGTTADQNTAQIGDTVNYKVTSKVPQYDGYKEYYLDFNDTLSKGLTFNTTGGNSGVTVTIGGTTLTTENYTVTVGEYDDEDGTAISIHFKDLVSRSTTFPPGSEIVITYSATVNDAAVLGNEGNPNEVTLDYTNNPLNSGDGTPDNPSDEIPHGTTPPSEVNTYVTEIDLLKIDAQTEAALAGAVFNIKGSTINKVLITGQRFVEDNTNGTYYKLTDGTYTTDAPTTATATQYASSVTKYKLEDYTDTSIEETADVEFQAVSGADGYIKVAGLKEGTYTFTEIQAPDGYNLLTEPIVVTVSSNIDSVGTVDATSGNPVTFAWAATSDDATVSVTDGIISFSVRNNGGAELPTTGGIGTTLFYLIGTILVIGAGVLMVTRRRMKKFEQ